MSDPAEVPPEKLESFVGVITEQPHDVEEPLFSFELKGEFLHVEAKGNPAEAIPKAYGDLYKYISENNVQIKSNNGYQVNKMVDGVMISDIYVELAS